MRFNDTTLNGTRRRCILAASVITGALITLAFIPRQNGLASSLNLTLGIPGIFKWASQEDPKNSSITVRDRLMSPVRSNRSRTCRKELLVEIVRISVI